MDRWENCAGSVRECEGKESLKSEAADRGTDVHGLCERFLKSELPPNEFHALDNETKESITLYYNTVTEVYEAHPDAKMGIEHQFSLEEVHPGCFGTCDAWVWRPDTRILYIFDYKNGVSPVEIKNNAQFLYYALGALVTLKFPALFIEMVVVQPRAKHKLGPVRRWRIPAMEILDFEDRLVKAALATEKKDAPLVPGRYCFFCPATFSCPAHLAQRQADAKNVFSDLPVVEEDDPFS